MQDKHTLDIIKKMSRGQGLYNRIQVLVEMEGFLQEFQKVLQTNDWALINKLLNITLTHTLLNENFQEQPLVFKKEFTQFCQKEYTIPENILLKRKLFCPDFTIFNLKSIYCYLLLVELDVDHLTQHKSAYYLSLIHKWRNTPVLELASFQLLFKIYKKIYLQIKYGKPN